MSAFKNSADGFSLQMTQHKKKSIELQNEPQLCKYSQAEVPDQKSICPDRNERTLGCKHE